MILGSIVFGPQSRPTDRQYWRNMASGATSDLSVAAMGCNCVGPQPGETKCPCALRGEMEMGRKMVDEGVTINGKRYRLVPEQDPA